MILKTHKMDFWHKVSNKILITFHKEVIFQEDY
jgi:ABC-type polar amino acid transport system ATPase subunit